MMSHAHSSSFSCLHMSVPPLSSLSSTATSQVTLPINKHCADPQNEEYGSVANTTSSTGYEPNEIDNLDYSETCTAIFQNESVDIDTELSYSCDVELDDEFIIKALSSPQFTQRREPASLRHTHYSHKERLLPAQSFFHPNKYGKPCANQVQIVSKNGNQVATWKTSRSGFSLKDTKSKFLLKSDL